MNILFHDYGGYAFSQQVARRLSQNHTITYLYSSDQLVKRCGDPASRTFASKAVSTGRPLAKYNLVNRYLWEQSYGKTLAAHIRAERPRVVISANTPLDSQRILAQACRETRSRFIFWFQDAIGLAMENILRHKIPVMGGLMGRYYQQMERRLLVQSDRVILISPGFYPLLDDWGIERTKTHVIPNWAPLEEIPPMDQDNTWSRGHGLDKTVNFLYSGILGYKHNPEMFVSLAEHFKTDDRVRVVVVSEGGGADWLRGEQQRQGLPNLILLPFQPAEVYPQVLASASVLVSLINADASRFSVPSKVLTYLCAGRPVLLSMTHQNEAAGMVESAQAGLVSEPGDAAGWISQAETLVNQPDLRESLGRNARAYAEKHFALEPIYRQFEAILAEYE